LSYRQNAVRDFLLSVGHGAMKVFRVFDGTNRLVTQYEAGTDAAAGDDCLRTDYGYDGATTRILKLKESIAQWDASWDL
jgi:pyruvate carboxylase